jgi:hypothetical protein
MSPAGSGRAQFRGARDRVWPIIMVAFVVYEAIWWGVWLIYPPGIWFFVP